MDEPGLICYDIESWLGLHELSPEDDEEPFSQDADPLSTQRSSTL